MTIINDIAKKKKIVSATSIAGALLLAMIPVAIGDTSTKTADVISVYAATETIDDIEFSNKDLTSRDIETTVVSEKIAIDPKSVFTETNEINYILENGTELKDGPYDENNTVLTLNKHNEVTLIGFNEFEYSKVLVNNTEYFLKKSTFVNTKDLVFDDVSYPVYPLEDGTNIKEAPDKDSATIAQVNRFAEINVIGDNDTNWLKVSYENEIRYMNKNKVTTDTGKIFSDMSAELYTNTNVRLRVAPGSGDSYETLPLNTLVSIIGQNDNGYYKISHNGNIGYIKKEYLSSEKTIINQYKASFTAYCLSECNSIYTANGDLANYANNTCAAPSCIPFGTKIRISGTGTYLDGKTFTVTDRGGAVTVRSDGSYVFDILMNTYSECVNFGRRGGTVTIVN